jgi:TadE-like protein
MKKLKANERGASAVEFAIILPLLVLILWGIIEFSILLYDKAMLTNLSREAARAAIVFGNRGFTQAQLHTFLDTDSYVSGIRAKYTEQLVSFKPGGGVLPPQVYPVDSGLTGAGQTVTIEVTYDYHWLYFPSWFGAVKTLTTRTSMRRE